MNSLLGSLAIVVPIVVSATTIACSSSTSTTPSATQSTAAAVAGSADTHCGGKVVKVDPAACHPADAGAAETDADPGTDQGSAVADFGETMYGSSGNDDDCKYHVSWTSSPVSENSGVTFVFTVTNLSDGTPATGATPYIEALLDDHTPAPNSNATTTESPAGVYTVGPVLFNKPGKWTVRLHLAGTCADGEDSPHGHGAFFVAVP